MIVLCEGYKQQGDAEISIVSASTVFDAEEVISKWEKLEEVGNNWLQRPLMSLMPVESSSCYQRLLQSPEVKIVGDLLDLTIGIVTGNSKFFVITKSDAEKRGLPAETLQPILSKFSHCEGVELTDEDLRKLREADKRCLFINTRLVTEPSDILSGYLDSYPEKSTPFK